MRYRVEITRAARHDIGDTYYWLQENAEPPAADRWLLELHEAMATLAELPHRCPPAPEAPYFGDQPRQLLFRTWRVIYEVVERRVVVVHVRSMAARLDQPRGE